MEVVSKVLSEERDAAKEILDDIIESEQGYLFTNDYEYLMKRSDIIQKPQDQQMDSQAIFVWELRTRVDQYFKLVIQNLRDRVPKIIGFFLVFNCQDKIQFHLYNEINRNQQLAEALGEHPSITEERNKLKGQLDILNHSSKVLMRDPDITAVAQIGMEEEEKKPPAVRPQRSAGGGGDSSPMSSNRSQAMPPRPQQDFFDNFD